MFPFFETIRYTNGIPENLTLHQQRVDYTLKHFSAKTSIDLANHIQSMTSKPIMDNKVYKCRFKYDVDGHIDISFEPYSIKTIQTISIHDIGSYQYPFKYTERTWLNNIARTAGTDEVILTHKGFIKDASYANLAFFDGKTWMTPSQPLLMGTRRASLINAKTIIESPIQVKELEKFSFVKCINAMMLWEESPMIKIEHSLFKSF
jgi:4-amino-4-deoxychorismate lyase